MVNHLKDSVILTVFYTCIMVGVAVFVMADDNSNSKHAVEYQQF